jgi:Family of unknown function (DUF6049)
VSGARRIACSGLAVIVVVLAVASGPTSATNPAAAQASGLLALVAQTAAIAPNETFHLQLRVTGAPPQSQLELRVHDRVLTRSQFQASLDGERLRTRLTTLTLALDETPPDASGTITVDLPTRVGGGDPAAVRLVNPGVYPVRVELRDEEGAALTEIVTHIVRLPAADPPVIPLRVALAVPIHAPPALQPDGSTALDGNARAGIVTVASALQRSSIGLTVVPTPETVISLGEDPASPDAALLEAVRRGAEGRQLVAGPYVDIDAAAWLQAEGLTTLARELDSGLATLTERFTDVDSTTSLADPSLDTATASWLRDRGVSRFVLREDGLEPLDPAVFPTTLTQPFLVDGVDGVQATVADAALAAHVGSTGDAVLDGHHLLADLAVVYLDQPPASRGVVVRLPETVPLDPAFLAAVIDGLGGLPIVRPVPPSAVFDEVPVSGADGETDGTGEPLRRVLRPVPADDIGTLAGRMATAEADVSSFTLTAAGADDVAHLLDRRLLVAPGRELSPTEQSALLRANREDIERELAHVDLPDRQTFTLTARQGLVPLSVRNTAGYPMAVQLHFTGERLEFPDHPDGRLDLELTQEITRIEITVRTLTSGDAPLTLSVTTLDQRRELDRSRFTVRSTAVTGVGLALIGGSLLFLAAWWGRNIHRARRNRRLMPSRPPN